MLESSILQVAIGMIFVYSLLSILVTQINTLILNFFNLRSKDLKKGLMTLVQDRDLQARILAHPLIRMVDGQVKISQKLSSEQAEAIISAKPSKVEYIPPDTFVEALISVLTAESDYTLYKPLDDAINLLPNDDHKLRLRDLYRRLRSFTDTSTAEIRSAIMALPDENHRLVLTATVDYIEDSLGRLPIKSGGLIPLLEGINRIENPHFKDAVETILISAKSLEDARGKLQVWFNDGMNRVSDAFRRNLQWISLGIGLLLALVMNADTLQIARSLIESPGLRQEVAAAAQSIAPQLEDQSNAASQSLQGTQGNTSAQATEQIQATADDIKYLLQTLDSLQLPLGWEYTTLTDEIINASVETGLPDPRSNARNLWNLWPGNNPNGWLGLLIQKIGGFIITTIAVAQGAPFWFDLLRRIAGGKTSDPIPAPTANTVVNVHLDKLPMETTQKQSNGSDAVG